MWVSLHSLSLVAAESRARYTSPLPPAPRGERIHTGQALFPGLALDSLLSSEFRWAADTPPQRLNSTGVVLRLSHKTHCIFTLNNR